MEIIEIKNLNFAKENISFHFNLEILKADLTQVHNYNKIEKNEL